MPFSHSQAKKDAAKEASKLKEFGSTGMKEDVAPVKEMVAKGANGEKARKGMSSKITPVPEASTQKKEKKEKAPNSKGTSGKFSGR